MTGPEHYREAERLAERSYHFTYGDGCDTATGAALASLANAHATLALAAATALCHPGDDQTLTEEANAWQDTAGTTPGKNGPCTCDHHGDCAGCGTDCECAR